MEPGYRHDLAYIHDAGFGFLAENAARTAIEEFRKVGDLYRRDSEVHHLQLVDSAEIVASLQGAGFSVQTHSIYGSFALPKGLVGFPATGDPTDIPFPARDPESSEEICDCSRFAD